MAHKNLHILIFTVGGLLLAFVLFLSNSLAYSDKTTHPDLTREIISFYELSTGKKFTDEQKQWIIQGSIDEDFAPRWLNHFYDPIFEKGLSTPSPGVNGYLAKHWARFSSYQSINPENIGNLWTGNGPVISGSWWGDFSYEAAVKDYSKDKEKEAYIALGHILHLIEDMTVPEHTRNDAHPGGNMASIYEDWTKDNSSGLTQDLGKRIFNQGQKSVIYADLESYFNNLATYTNNYFFSSRTIKSDIYQRPKIVYEDGTFAYGKDENNQYFDLAIYVTDKSLKKIYSLKDGHYQVMQEYWLRLSRQAVINGAGVIELFLNQATAARDAELAKKKTEESQQLGKKSSFLSQIINFFRSPDAPKSEPALMIKSEPNKPLPRIVKQETVAKPAAVQKPAAPAQPKSAPKIATPNSAPAPAPTLTQTPAPAPAPAPQTSAPIVYGGGGSSSNSSSNSNQTTQQNQTQNSTQENIEISTFQTGDLVINEIMYDLEGADGIGNDSHAHEWIELYNNSSHEIGITGWKFDDGATSLHGLNEPPTNGSQGSMIILASGYAVLSGNAAIFSTDHSGFGGTVIDTVMSLQNSTSTIKISAPDGTVIDEVTYSSSWGAGGNGKTLERKSAAEGSNDAANWAQSSAPGGTPGVANNWELATSTPDTATSTPETATSTPTMGLGTDVSATTTIAVNTTWTLAGSPYRLIFNSVNHPMVAPGAILTIEPGVKIIPQGGGYTAMEIQGTLSAIATSGAPIIFTSINDADDSASTTPQKGEWLNIVFSQGSQANLDYVEFRYGGYGFELPFREMVKITGAAVNINHSKFENSQNTALHLVDAGVTVANSVFTDNRCGISVDSILDIAIAADGSCSGYHSSISRAAATTTPQIRNNQFIRNQLIGIEIRNGATPVIDGNIFTDNGYPARIESAYPTITNSQVVNSTTSPNIINGIAISGRTHFTQNHTLKKDLPYILETNGPGLMPYVDKGGTLTIEPGVIFKTGNTNSVLSMGCFNCYYPECVNCEGHLIVQGTAENPVVFTSLKDDARGGDTNGDSSATSPQDVDWGNIRFNASSSGTFANTNFYYGGFGYIAPLPAPPILLADFPAVSPHASTNQFYVPIVAGYSGAYLQPDHSGTFDKVIIHNFTWANPTNHNLNLTLFDKTNGWQQVAAWSLSNQQNVSGEFTINFPPNTSFIANHQYTLFIGDPEVSPNPMTYYDAAGGGTTGAAAFYESAVQPYSNPALSIDAGATVVVQ